MSNTADRRKKLIIILILCAMMVPVLSVKILAVSTRTEMTSQSTTVKQGSNVVVKVKAKDMAEIKSGMDGFSAILEYDTKVLSYTSSKALINGWDIKFTAGSNLIIGGDEAGGNTVKGDVEFYEMTFKVLDNAPIAETSIKLKDIKVSDTNYKTYRLSEEILNLNVEKKDEVVPPAKSKNTNLKSLSVNTGTLSPQFNKDTLKYTVNVPYTTEKITISASVEDPKSSVTQGTGEKILNVGKNTITLTVKAEDGATKDYVIDVIRADKEVEPTPDPSSDSNLDDLTVSDGILSPAFDPNETDYTVTVGDDVDKITIGGSASDGKSTIDGFGDYDLVEGENKIVIEVTAEDGSTKEYVVTVVKDSSIPLTPIDPSNPKEEPQEPEVPQDGNSSNNYVNNIQGIGSMKDSFNKHNYYYQTTVGRETTKVEPVVDLEDKEATYRLIGADNLKIGKNTVILEVTAANGEVKEYIFEIYRSEEENNSLLSSLQVGGYAFNPGFREDVNYYTLNVDSEITTLGVSASPKHGGALVNISGNEKLNYGVNLIKVAVTGDNGMNTYMVEVVRAHEESKQAILPWIITGVSAFIILALFMALYYTKRMERLADDRFMQDRLYNQVNNGYNGNNQPFNQGGNQAFVNPTQSNNSDDIETMFNLKDAKDVRREYHFSKEKIENGKVVLKKYKIVEEIDEDGNNEI